MQPNEELPVDRGDIEQLEKNLARIEKKVDALGVAALYLVGVTIGIAHRYESNSEITKAVKNSAIVRDLNAAFYPEELKNAK